MKSSEGFRVFKDIVFIFLLGWLVYRWCFANRFLYDDIKLIVINPGIRDFQGFLDLLSGGRAVRTFTFFLDYALWGYRPRGYFVTNILLHTLTAVALYVTTLRLFGNRDVALAGGLLFTAHPAFTEAVGVISHRKEMLVCLFMLLSLNFYLLRGGYFKRSAAYLGSLLAYFLALNSKQVAIVLPFLLYLSDWVQSEEKGLSLLRSRGVFYLPYIFLPAIFVFLKAGDWRLFAVFPLESFFNTEYYHILSTSPWAFAKYIFILIMPVHLTVDPHFPFLNSFLDPKCLLGLFIISLLIITAVRVRRDHPLVTFSIGWIVINLIPVLNIIPVNEPFAERYLYVPGVGFCLLLAWALSSLTRPREALAHIIYGVLIFFLVLFGLEFTFRFSYKPYPYLSSGLILLFSAAVFGILLHFLLRKTNGVVGASRLKAMAFVVVFFLLCLMVLPPVIESLSRGEVFFPMLYHPSLRPGKFDTLYNRWGEMRSSVVIGRFFIVFNYVFILSFVALWVHRKRRGETTGRRGYLFVLFSLVFLYSWGVKLPVVANYLVGSSVCLILPRRRSTLV